MKTRTCQYLHSIMSAVGKNLYLAFYYSFHLEFPINLLCVINAYILCIHVWADNLWVRNLQQESKLKTELKFKNEITIRYEIIYAPTSLSSPLPRILCPSPSEAYPCIWQHTPLEPVTHTGCSLNIVLFRRF